MPLSVLPGQAVFAAIDFESAGVTRGDTDTPIQIGIAVMRGLDTAAVESFVSYLHTDRPVTWQASHVHGITTADLTGAPTMLGLWPEVKARLGGRLIVAHGAGTEKRFLRAYPMHGFGPWVDTLKLARRFWPGVRDYTLETLILAGGQQDALNAACPGRRFHDALYDAVASLLVLRHIILHAGLAELPVDRWLNHG